MLSYLLFIIFGRKVRDKDYGPSYPLNCPRCNNGVYFHAYKWRSWFHIYWIPLIPWFSHKKLICPICQAGLDLDRSEFKAAKALVDDTQRYRERQMAEEAYDRSLRDFEAEVSFVDDEEPVEDVEATSDELENELSEADMEDPEVGVTPKKQARDP